MQHAVFGPIQQYINDTLSELGCQPLPRFIADATAELPDRCLQLTSRRFEYPQYDLPGTVSFAGPLLPQSDFDQPDWWPALDNATPLVVVTQGTLANADLGELIAPTLQALADLPFNVLAVTGGPSVDQIPMPLPANARAAVFVPFDHLLPKADVLVTNGGFGAVNHAMSLGVPLVVAGDSEEKPEIAARVARCGAGIDLASGRPEPALLQQAVMDVLWDARYRQGAKAMQEDFARYDAMDAIEGALAEVCA